MTGHVNIVMMVVIIRLNLNMCILNIRKRKNGH